MLLDYRLEMTKLNRIARFLTYSTKTFSADLNNSINKYITVTIDMNALHLFNYLTFIYIQTALCCIDLAHTDFAMSEIIDTLCSLIAN